MPGDFDQYAVYWVPKGNDALARFGASWTGWCADQGAPRSRDALDRLSIDIPAVTRQLCHHGFHSAIKKPFRLRPDLGRFSVEHVLGRLCEDHGAFELPRLQLTIKQGSVVLTSFQPCPALSSLATQVDQAMAPFELTPVSDGDSAHANTDKVIQFPTSSAHRFLIPLTDRLEPKAAQLVMEALQPLLAPMLDLPRRLHEVALMGDPGGGRPVRVLEFYELSHQPPHGKSSALHVQGPDVLVPMPTSRTPGPRIVH